MKKTLLIILTIFIAGFSFAQSTEEKIWQRVEALTKAVFETKDSIALQELVSSRVTYGHSSGVLEDKPTMVQKATSSKTTYKNRAFERVSIDVDKKTALIRHNLRAISIEDGKEAPLDLSIFQVWRKEGGTWRLWARQAVRIPAKS